MKIAIKNKSEMKYIDSSQLQVGDITLEELYNKVNHQDEIIASLVTDDEIELVVNTDGVADIVTFNYYTTSIREF